MNGLVDAGIISTPLVGRFEGVNTVIYTESVPHMALLVSHDVPEDIALKVQKSLIDAEQTAERKVMLESLNLDRFITAANADYAGYARLLEGFSVFKFSH